MENAELLNNLNELYGIHFESADGKKPNRRSYVKINKNKLANAGGILHDMPYIAKMMHDEKFFSEAYLVIFDKGLGTLQKSAKTPGLFRANIVEFGTNNSVTGQAELAKLNPSEMMQLSQIALSAMSVASVITNQYYLANINERLKSIEDSTSKIIKILEDDKKMRQLADNHFLTEKMEYIDFIEKDDAYRQATLVNVQQIKISADQNSRFYRKRLIDQINALSVKDKKNDTNKFVGEYESLIPQYWFATLIYGLASYLEAKLSGITDEAYFNEIENDILHRVSDYKKDVESIENSIENYIDSVKYLKDLKNIETAAGVLVPIVGGVLGGVAGVQIGEGLTELLKKYNKDKKKAKEELIIEIHKILLPYLDYGSLSAPANALDDLSKIYNKPVEILVDEDAIYIRKNAHQHLQQAKRA